MPKFDWPTVVISGGRDLVTPRAVAERIASLVPNAVLVKLPTLAHSALDFREPAALAIAGAVCRGELDGLADQGAGAGRTAGAPGHASACCCGRLDAADAWCADGRTAARRRRRRVPAWRTLESYAHTRNACRADQLRMNPIAV